MKKQSKDDRGLIHGYKPNPISLWIILLISGRHERLLNTTEFTKWLHKALYKEMEPYKLKNKTKDDKEEDIDIDFVKCIVCNEAFRNNGNEYCSYHCATGG